MENYRTIPIKECGEPLVPIPEDLFAHFEPAPYLALGASYDGASPWMLRQGVLDALTAAQQRIQALRPRWKIMIFDAFRPQRIQIFMVEREFSLRAKAAGLDPTRLTTTQREALANLVFRYWAVPSDDPATPPPHSTGAALDLTLADESGREVAMGSLIDEGAPPQPPPIISPPPPMPPDAKPMPTAPSSKALCLPRVFANIPLNGGISRAATRCGPTPYAKAEPTPPPPLFMAAPIYYDNSPLRPPSGYGRNAASTYPAAVAQG